jgi:hypothetical protein
MHDMCDTREMCEARKSRSSRACRASSRDPCMRDVWGMPRPADLRACEASDPAGHYILLDADKPAENHPSPIQIIPDPLPGHEVYNVLSHYLQGYREGKFRDFAPEDIEYEITLSMPDSYNVTKVLARNLL